MRELNEPYINMPYIVPIPNAQLLFAVMKMRMMINTVARKK